ncbi:MULTISPECIES: protoglobin domain-containing protein [unclassified Mycobacterium]|uniref:protoglobin domain-containing protein n=1 Tax=unclassified Mycobacterium TaxID=2642494 RepID=UPI0029C6B7AD|nr:MULTISPECIES: globin domain-containing protein [unclassified Mycobacterium]
MTVTLPDPPVVHDELEAHHAEVIRATLPLVGANVDEITTVFYRMLFDNHPALLRNLFNRGNQAQGAQQRALAASIATYATHLVDPELPHPSELLSRIGHKHASLGITADQYGVVYDNLFAAIVEVLGADTVTSDVAAAWDRVYWIMANTLIALERDLYAAAGVADGDVHRRATVVSRVDDPSGAVLLSVHPVDGVIPDNVPGQYVSVGVTMPDGARQLRQYSLVNAPGADELVFAVKPVDAAGDAPAGEVSNWIAANVRVGDLLDITMPFGDLPAPESKDRSTVLISAGVGITPMIGLLEYFAAQTPDRHVRVLHADRGDKQHPLRERQHELVAQLPNGSLDVWYEDGLTGQRDGVHAGRMLLADVSIPADAEVYLCGSNGFVQAVRAQLTDIGVPADQVHCELFSPNDWLLG